MAFGIPNPRKLKRPSATGAAKSYVKKSILVALSPFLIPAAFIAIVLMLFIITPLVIFGKASQDGQFAQSVGLDGYFNNTPVTQPPAVPPGGGGNPSVDCANPDTFFSENDIGIIGITSPSKKQLLCQNLDVLLSYPDIDRYLASKRIIFASSDHSSCPGFADGCTHLSGITLLNFDTSTESDSHWSAIINHEFFHALDNITNIKNGYQDPYSSDKNKCYDITNKGYYIISSYGKKFADGLSSAAVTDESFAESGALYVTGKGTDGTIGNFNINCPGNSGFWSDTIGVPSASSSDPVLSSGNLCTQGNTNNCGLSQYSRYMSKNPTGLNFGDPSCDLVSGGGINRQMVRDEIMKQLQSYNKTVDYCRWSCIAFHEGGYNPNSYNGNASRPSTGAWGMFQMTPWACYDTSKPYYYNRTGNVGWKEQISRALATQYKQLVPHGIPWHYWNTYKFTCFKEPDYSPGGNCLDIGL